MLNEEEREKKREEKKIITRVMVVMGGGGIDQTFFLFIAILVRGCCFARFSCSFFTLSLCLYFLFLSGLVVRRSLFYFSSPAQNSCF